jgi:hypothetical protein
MRFVYAPFSGYPNERDLLYEIQGFKQTQKPSVLIARLGVGSMQMKRVLVQYLVPDRHGTRENSLLFMLRSNWIDSSLMSLILICPLVFSIFRTKETTVVAS